MATVNCLVTNILPDIFFCVQQNKEIPTALEQHELNSSIMKQMQFQL